MFRSQEHRVVQVGYWELQKILQTVQWRYSENRILQRTLFRIFLVERKWYIGVNIPYTLKYLRLGRESIFWQIFSWFLVNNQNCMQNPVKHLRWNSVNGGTLLTILSKSSILDVWQGFIYASGSVFSTKLASNSLEVIKYVLRILSNFNPLSTNPTKWSNTYKSFVGKN